MSRTAADIIEIGRDLIAQKGALGHGNYLAWIEAEFGMSDQTARRFTHVAGTVGGKSNIVLDLPPSVLYALAAPRPRNPSARRSFAAPRLARRSRPLTSIYPTSRFLRCRYASSNSATRTRASQA
jgi:hypothetical protein